MTKIRLLYVVLLLLFSMGAAAEEFKIAVIDMEKVFQEYYKTKIADATIKRQAEIYKQYSDKLNESLLKLQEEFKNLRDSAQNIALSDVERENKRLGAQDKFRQLKEKEEEFKQYGTDKQSQLREQYEEQRNVLLNEIRETIQRRCKAEGYMLVLDMSGKTLNNIPSIVYSNPTLDLTESVLKEINMAAEKDSKKDDKKSDVPDKAEKSEKPAAAPAAEKAGDGAKAETKGK